MRIPYEELSTLKQVGSTGVRKVVAEIQRLGIAEQVVGDDELLGCFAQRSLNVERSAIGLKSKD
jgi:hypothetical protein